MKNYYKKLLAPSSDDEDAAHGDSSDSDESGFDDDDVPADKSKVAAGTSRQPSKESSVGRADSGVLKPLLAELQEHPGSTRDSVGSRGSALGEVDDGGSSRSSQTPSPPKNKKNKEKKSGTNPFH